MGAMTLLVDETLFCPWTEGGVSFTYYVDSVNGSDGYSGRSAKQAKATIAGVMALSPQAGESIGLARGSSWREQLTVPADHMRIGAYGVGARPLLDCSDAIAAGAWTKTAGRTYVYQASVVIEQFPDGFMSLWENDTRYRVAADVAACDATAGTYYCADMSTSPATVYVHTLDHSNPGANGKTYEYPRRAQGVQCIRDYCSISGLHTRRNLSNNGSLEVRRFCSVSNCLVSEGSKHSMLCGGGCVVANVEAADSYYAGQSKAAIGWNQDAGQGEDLTFSNCYVHDEFEPGGQCAFYGHVNLSGAFGTIRLLGCRAESVQASFPANGQCSQVIIDDCDLWIVGCMVDTTISNSTIRGGQRCLSSSGAPTIRIRNSSIISSNSALDGGDCAVFIDNVGATLDIQDSHITGTLKDGSANMINAIWFLGYGILTSRRNTFENYAHFYLIDGEGYAVDSDYNEFDGPLIDTQFRLPGYVWQTMAQWQALGYDRNSAIGG